MHIFIRKCIYTFYKIHLFQIDINLYTNFYMYKTYIYITFLNKQTDSGFVTTTYDPVGATGGEGKAQ